MADVTRPCNGYELSIMGDRRITSICYCGRTRLWSNHVKGHQLTAWLEDHDTYFPGIYCADKAADITDEAFVAAIKECIRRRNLTRPAQDLLGLPVPYHGWSSATRWDVASVLAGHPELVGTAEACQNFPNMPPKVVLAKARRLIRRGVIDGCECGCRGDFAVKSR